MEAVTIQEASLRLNVSQRTIRECIRNGELRAFRQPGPRGDRWVVELPEEGWLDPHKKHYLELAQRMPRWWWPTAGKSGRVHYLHELGVEEIEPVYLCGVRSDNIWNAAGHSDADRCEKCLQTATEQGLPL